MKTYFFTLLFIFGFVNYSLSQVALPYEVQQTIDFYKTNKFISESGTNTLTESKIKGSPYLNDEFVNGSIYTVQRQQFDDIPLRFNIFNDDLEFKTPGGEIQALATPEIVEKAVFGNTQLVYSPYLMANKTRKGFFIVLEEGNVSLYSKPGIIFREGTEPGAYKDPEPPKFVKKSDDYYLRVGSGQAQIIGNNKELVEAFPDNQDNIKIFMSKNKTKINKPDNLKEVVRYYNSL